MSFSCSTTIRQPCNAALPRACNAALDSAFAPVVNTKQEATSPYQCSVVPELLDEHIRPPRSCYGAWGHAGSCKMQL
eukprot:1974404-Amphidinium_carterae.1